MNGEHHPRSISVESHRTSVPALLEYMILFGIGAIAFLLHMRLKTPLNIPGHHGLEFMALMMAGRVASRIPWASSVSSLGVGMMLFIPVYGVTDPLMGFYYMLPGVFIDLFYRISRDRANQFLFLALIAGLAYTTIPLCRITMHFMTGYPYRSVIKHGGAAIPLLGFFVFGLAGGFAGGGITRSILSKLNRK